MKPYFSGLDLLRVFAAIWVMNFHYFMRVPGQLHWYRYGPYGVQLFFVISGFVILESISSRSVKDFAIGRFIRLYPLFWILCTFTYLFTLVWPHADPVPLRTYFISMTILGDWFSARLVDPSYWSLSVEVVFYAAIACFVALFTVRKVRWFLVVWLVVSAAAFLLHRDRAILMRLLLVRHAAYFVFGATLSLIVTETKPRPWRTVFDWALLCVSAAWGTFIHPRAVQPFEVTNPLDVPIVTYIHVAIFVGVVLAVSLSRFAQAPRTLRFCATLGGLTYPLYLVHQTIGRDLIEYFARFAPFWLVGVVVELGVVAASYAIYLQDKKLRSWLQKRLTHRRTGALMPGITSTPSAKRKFA